MEFSKLELLIERFSTEDMSLSELQSRLQTMILPDENNTKLKQLINESDNKFEELLFTAHQVNHKKYAIEIMGELLNKIRNIE
jgi:hypothetical protein